MSVEYSDIQGLLRFGFGKMPESRYFLLRVRDAAAARAWLAAAPVTTAETQSPPPDRILQVAFTASGLRALGVPEPVVQAFSPEFISGIAGESARSRRLGDLDDNAPSAWQWGGPGDSIDLLVALFAAHGRIEEWEQEVCRAPWSTAFDVRPPLTTSDLGGREPFGFVDGISQPELDWEGTRDASQDQLDYSAKVALGEFLLGYSNEYCRYTDRPLLDSTTPGAAGLAPAEDDSGRRDLGRNGSYLVMRQLEQDVRGFWRFIYSAAASEEDRTRLAEAMVGRRLANGDPLVPGNPPNNFTYDRDPDGVRCPFGSHIRRANPRNTDLPGRPSSLLARGWTKLGGGVTGIREDLLASTRFHRILRRGREYGPPLPPEEAARPATAAEPPRGIHFLCLNANISRQFEFVQNAWVMSGKFNGLPDESDPLLGAAGRPFSIPRDGMCPARVQAIPRFITVRGGAYFFLPGIRALRYFAGNPGGY